MTGHRRPKRSRTEIGTDADIEALTAIVLMVLVIVLASVVVPGLPY